jgi:glycerol-3-phosphate acyltransferase PlsY
MSWWIFIPIGIFVIMVAITRYVSIGSLTSTISVPVIFLTYHTYPHSGNSSDSVFIAFSILMALVVVLRQTSNIKRLLKGTENRFGVKAKKPAEDKTSMVIIPPDEEPNSENE